MTFVLYESMTALDLVGPYQVLSAVPQARIRLAAVNAGLKRTDNGMAIAADHALADLDESQVIIVPGAGDPQRRSRTSPRCSRGWRATARVRRGYARYARAP